MVEIAFNEIQVSPRYVSGLALRFARVKRYRTDKTAAEADTFETVQRLAGILDLKTNRLSHLAGLSRMHRQCRRGRVASRHRDRERNCVAFRDSGRNLEIDLILSGCPRRDTGEQHLNRYAANSGRWARPWSRTAGCRSPAQSRP